MVYTDKAHLVADTFSEMHQFAKSIGLKQEYFQGHPDHPYYIIWGKKVTLAIKNGAEVIRPQKLLNVSKSLKNDPMFEMEMVKDPAYFWEKYSDFTFNSDKERQEFRNIVYNWPNRFEIIRSIRMRSLYTTYHKLT